MPLPTYEKFLRILRTANNNGGNSRVLALMKNQIVPQISCMRKAQLVEALAEAIYALYHEEALRNSSEDATEFNRQQSSKWKQTSAYLTETLREAPRTAAKKAADARHSMKGGSRDLKAKIIIAWSSGNYSSRDICAEREYKKLGYGSFKAARTALIGVPDPSPWPAKKIRRRR